MPTMPTPSGVLACLLATPGRSDDYPKFPWYLFVNCQTDAFSAAAGCCLGGFRPLTGIPNIPVPN